MRTNGARKSIPTVYCARMMHEASGILALYIGKHKTKFAELREHKGHTVYRDGYAGNGLYIYSTGNFKLPTYNFADQSWPGLFMQHEGLVKIEVEILTFHNTCQEALAYEAAMIERYKERFPHLVVNLPPNTCN